MGVAVPLHPNTREMSYDTDRRRLILDLADLLLWFTRKDLVEFLTGSRERRVKFVEYQLPRLAKDKKLFRIKRDGNYKYSKRTKRGDYTADMYHGLLCTKALLKFKKSIDGEFVPESFFRKKRLGAVPEWGLIYDKKNDFV